MPGEGNHLLIITDSSRILVMPAPDHLALGSSVRAVDDLAFLFRRQIFLSRPRPGTGVAGHDATQGLDLRHNLGEVGIPELLLDLVRRLVGHRCLAEV